MKPINFNSYEDRTTLSGVFRLFQAGKPVAPDLVRFAMRFCREAPEAYLKLHNEVCDWCAGSFKACLLRRKQLYDCKDRGSESVTIMEAPGLPCEHLWAELRESRVPAQHELEFMIQTFDGDPDDYRAAADEFCENCRKAGVHDPYVCRMRSRCPSAATAMGYLAKINGPETPAPAASCPHCGGTGKISDERGKPWPCACTFKTAVAEAPFDVRAALIRAQAAREPKHVFDRHGVCRLSEFAAWPGDRFGRTNSDYVGEVQRRLGVPLGMPTVDEFAKGANDEDDE